MENLKDDDDLLREKGVHEKKPSLCSHLKEGVLEIERPGFWLPLRIRTWLAPGPFPRVLPWRLSASLFVWIPLEANLGLGSLRSKAAPTTSSVFGTDT